MNKLDGTTAKLNELAELMAQKDVLAMTKKDLLDGIIPEAIRDRIAEVQAEFADREQAVDEKIEKLKEVVKTEVLAKGETVRGEHLMAVYSETTRWDSKMLIGISKVIPQVAEASRVDKNVTVRRC